jgi:hypothetical protein
MRVEKYYYKLPIIKTNNVGDFVSNLVQIYRDQSLTDPAGYMQDYYVHQHTNFNRGWLPHFKTKVITFSNNKSVSFCYIANKKESIEGHILYKSNMGGLSNVKREIIKIEDNTELCYGMLKFYFK